MAGVRYIANGTQHSQAAEAVILACGGFGANRQLIERHAPQFGKLATTNGPFALGEGLALAQAAGAQLIDLDQVQVHPTGFLDPKDPENSVKVRLKQRFHPRNASLHWYGHSCLPIRCDL